jgi:hypothetical protein
MKRRLIRDIASGLIIVVLMVMSLAVGVMAQTDTSASNFAADLSSVINGIGLPQDKFETALKLTKTFLIDLQKTNQELTQLVTPPQGTSSQAGSHTGDRLDPKPMEKINVKQREFGIKLEQYKLDLADAIGESNAVKITEKIQQIIPRVLLQNSQITVGNNSGHTGMSGMPGMSATNPVNGLAEVPMGAMPNNPANDNTSIIPDISMPGMNSTPGMNNNPSTTMPGTPGITNNTAGSGIDAVNRQILLQLQASNSTLMQMLSIISNQSNSKTLVAQFQPIYQMIANQSMLIQMIYINLNAGFTSGGSASSSSSGMGNMGGMGTMGGMGKMGGGMGM